MVRSIPLSLFLLGLVTVIFVAAKAPEIIENHTWSPAQTPETTTPAETPSNIELVVNPPSDVGVEVAFNES
jgi:hypothetical protein